VFGGVMSAFQRMPMPEEKVPFTMGQTRKSGTGTWGKELEKTASVYEPVEGRTRETRRKPLKLVASDHWTTVDWSKVA